MITAQGLQRNFSNACDISQPNEVLSGYLKPAHISTVKNKHLLHSLPKKYFLIPPQRYKMANIFSLLDWDLTSKISDIF